MVEEGMGIQRNVRTSLYSSLHLVTCMVRPAHGSFSIFITLEYGLYLLPIYPGFLLFISLILPPPLAPWIDCIVNCVAGNYPNIVG